MKTKKEYETYLNELFADCYSRSQAIDEFCYCAAEEDIISGYENHVLGSLLRDKDHIRFEVGYNEWKNN